MSDMPFLDSINPIGDELYWIQSISLGKQTISLSKVKNCQDTWIWDDGEDFSPKYTTYIILTCDDIQERNELSPS